MLTPLILSCDVLKAKLHFLHVSYFFLFFFQLFQKELRENFEEFKKKVTRTVRRSVEDL